MGQRQGTKGALAHLADLGLPPHQRRLAAHEKTCLRFRSVWGKWIAFRTPDNWPVPHPRSRTPHPRRRFAAPPRQEEDRTCVCTAEPGISARGARGKGLRTSNLCSLKPPKKGYDAPSPKTNSEGSFVVPRASLTDSPAPIIRPRRYSASSTRRWTPA